MCRLLIIGAIFLPNLCAAADQLTLVYAARKAYQAKESAFQSGLTNDVEALHLWSCRCMDAEGKAATDSDRKLKAYQRHLDRMKPLAATIAARTEAGSRGGTLDNQEAAKYFVVEAEMWLREQKSR